MRQWLIDLRLKKLLSQKEVCEAVGIAQPTYWEYEHGKSRPSPETAQRLGEVLGFDWTRFFTEKTKEERE